MLEKVREILNKRRKHAADEYKNRVESGMDRIYQSGRLDTLDEVIELIIRIEAGEEPKG